jgi:hypothetical protein
MSYNYLVWYWTCEFIISKLYPHFSGQKQHNTLVNDQSCQKIQINSRERLQITKICHQAINKIWTNLKIEERVILLFKISTTIQQMIWCIVNGMKPQFLNSERIMMRMIRDFKDDMWKQVNEIQEKIDKQLKKTQKKLNELKENTNIWMNSRKTKNR